MSKDLSTGLSARISNALRSFVARPVGCWAWKDGYNETYFGLHRSYYILVTSTLGRTMNGIWKFTLTNPNQPRWDVDSTYRPWDGGAAYLQIAAYFGRKRWELYMTCGGKTYSALEHASAYQNPARLMSPTDANRIKIPQSAFPCRDSYTGQFQPLDTHCWQARIVGSCCQPPDPDWTRVQWWTEHQLRPCNCWATYPSEITVEIRGAQDPWDRFNGSHTLPRTSGGDGQSSAGYNKNFPDECHGPHMDCLCPDIFGIGLGATISCGWDQGRPAYRFKVSAGHMFRCKPFNYPCSYLSGFSYTNEVSALLPHETNGVGAEVSLDKQECSGYCMTYPHPDSWATGGEGMAAELTSVGGWTMPDWTDC